MNYEEYRLLNDTIRKNIKSSEKFVINEDIYISNVDISKPLVFNNIEINGSLKIEDCKLIGGINIEECYIGNDLYIGGQNEIRGIEINSCEFKNIFHISGCKRIGDVLLNKSTFCDTAAISRTYGSDIEITRCGFLRSLIFDNDDLTSFHVDNCDIFHDFKIINSCISRGTFVKHNRSPNIIIRDSEISSFLTQK